MKAPEEYLKLKTWSETESYGNPFFTERQVKELLQAMREDHDKEITGLKKALLDISAEARIRYASECEEVDWFNNNTPDVGQSIDYKRHPDKPEILKIVDTALTQFRKG